MTVDRQSRRALAARWRRTLRWYVRGSQLPRGVRDAIEVLAVIGDAGSYTLACTILPDAWTALGTSRTERYR